MEAFLSKYDFKHPEDPIASHVTNFGFSLTKIQSLGKIDDKNETKN